MAETVWPTIHAERGALADQLDELTDEQWAAPTMCGEWTVHQVLAHLVTAANMNPPKFFARMAGAGFNFNRYAQREVDRDSAGGPKATLAAFRTAQFRTSAPPGPKETWLGEAFVHGEDIRRALGIKHTYPPDQVVRAIDSYAKSDLIIGGKSRMAGLTWRAVDTEWSHGSGPLVEGPAISLLVASSGRKAALDDLAGPGVEILRDRA